MEVQWLLVCHGLATLLVVVSFLCGQWPIFNGTFIQQIHVFLTFGAYDYLRRLIAYTCGSKGSEALHSVEYYCCDRPNPTLQLIYVVILGVTYYIIVQTTFDYIPGYYIGEVHRYASLLAVAVGVLLFILTSFSDPGTVKAENVSQYVSAYPYDNIIFSEKECTTCKIQKPARSKHCSICGHCVARFDHHCAWMNNCIGEKNTRYFMAFLLWHFLLCIYGSIAVALVLAGQLKEQQVIRILTAYYGIENSFRTLAPYVLQWLMGVYDTQVLMIVFLGIISMLLAGFLAYHSKLGLTNTTTNETFKWHEYMSLQRRAKEARASTVALKASLDEVGQETKKQHVSKWKKGLWWRRSGEDEIEVVKTNLYDKGFLQNSLEIIFPPSTRNSFHANHKSKTD